MLPTNRDARNALPVWDGCFAYFPDVWAEVAKVSVLGNLQHNLGDKLFWNTHVSTDHANKVIRHMLDDAAGNVTDDDGKTMHLAKALWRIAAMLQLRCWARDGKDEHGKQLSKPGTEVERQPHAEPTPFSPFDWGALQKLRSGLPPIRPGSFDGVSAQPLLCLCGYTHCKKCQHP